MIKTFFLLINILLLSLLNAVSQNTVILDWNNEKSYGVDISSFEGSVYLESYIGLPSFQEILKLKNSTYSDVKIFDVKYSSVTEYEKLKLDNLSINDSVFYSVNILKSADTYFRKFLVFPYIKTGNSYQRITEFSYIDSRIKSINKRKRSSEKINSVLQNGDWFRMSVSEDGVYSVTFSDLQNLGLSTNNLSISSIRLYGNGGGMLPRLNSDFRYDDLQTTVKDIYAIGDCVKISGAQVAELEGNISGYNVAESLGYEIVPEYLKEKNLCKIKLQKLEKFQNNLWKLYKSNNYNLANLNNEVEICRCEGIKYSTLNNALENGFTSISELKLKTRVGMGPCQGRYCGQIVLDILKHNCGVQIKESDFFTSRIPFIPLNIEHLTELVCDE